MVETGEDLPLGLELGDQPGIVQADVHDLDGDPLVERLVGAPAFVHRGHAAAGDEAHDAEGPELQAQMRVVTGVGFAQAGFFVEQCFHVGGQRGVAAAVPRHGSAPLGARREVRHRLEDQPRFVASA